MNAVIVALHKMLNIIMFRICLALKYVDVFTKYGFTHLLVNYTREATFMMLIAYLMYLSILIP